MHGIRKSVLDAQLNNKGLAKRLVTLLVEHVHTNLPDVRYLIVPRPLSPMHIVLKSMNFDRIYFPEQPTNEIRDELVKSFGYEAFCSSEFYCLDLFMQVTNR